MAKKRTKKPPPSARLRGAATRDDNTRDDNTRDDNTRDDNTRDDNTRDDSESSTAKHCEPSTAKHSEPSTAKRSESSTAKHSEPSTAKHSEPSTAKRSEPSTAKHSEPSTAKHSEPSIMKRSEPSTAKHSEPSGAKRSEPSAAKRSEPSGAKRSELSVGAKRRAARRLGANASDGVADEPVAHARAEDRVSPFWFGYEVLWAKLATARFVIFALLAIDAVLQISHAPRYGAGGFNVAHLRWLDGIGPGRESFAIGQLALAYLLTLAALGTLTRVVLPLATALYAWLYFGSQLDSYQHHYLVVLVLLISCMVPWQRPVGATARTPVRAWAVRLLLVQLGIMYGWAAISKLNAAWLDGSTLQMQMSGAMRSLVDGSIGIKGAARFTVLVELALAVLVWWRRAWFVALPVGVVFHLGILASGLEIGLFAVLMLGFYVLVIPDRVFAEIGARVPSLPSAVRAAVTHWVLVVVGVGLGIALSRLVHLPSAFAVSLALAGAGLAWVAVERDRVRAVRFAIAHLAAIALWLAVDRASATAVDYYRFWGGNARRLGDPVASERAYRTLIDIAPEEPAGHYQLGRILLGRDEEAEGMSALREAQRLEPSRARAYMAEAEYLRKKGRLDEAIEKAKEATYAEPNSQPAQQLLQSLTGAPAAGARDPGTPAAGARDPARPDAGDDSDQ